MPRRQTLVLLAAALPAFAQDHTIDYSGLEEQFRLPANAVSIGVRYTGRSHVRFSNLGTITSLRAPGSATDEVEHTYDDGSVSVDTRTTTDGADLPDDGRTNSWSYLHAGQITADESGIAFHTYSTTSSGATVGVEAGAKTGLDLQVDRTFWRSRTRSIDLPPAYAAGFLLGFGLNDVNVKSRGTIRATLNTLTDTYSLLGAAPPVNTDGSTGYTAPSSVTQTITNPDGTTTDYTVDTTTLLANRPDSRVESAQADQAEIDGFWQVKGAYLTVRAGPWFRWQPTERASLRFSFGGSVSLLGLRLRYDERLRQDNVLAEIRATEETENQGYGVPGYFGGVDAEWWVTRRTSFFGGASYDAISKDTTLEAGERTAQVRLSDGLGLRVGITTRF